MTGRYIRTGLSVFLALVWLLAADALAAETVAQGAAGAESGQGNGEPKSLLMVSPQEVDLGVIGPGEEAKGAFSLKNPGPGRLAWSMEGPEGWSRTDDRTLAGAVEGTPEIFRIHLLFLKEEPQESRQDFTLILRLEGGGKSAAFHRESPVGELRVPLRFSSPGGAKTVFFRVQLARLVSAPLMEVAPVRIDCGTVRAGESITRTLQLTNQGKEILRWRAGTAGRRGMPTQAAPLAGRYLSFLNEAVAGKGSYLPAVELQERLELSGDWDEEGGHPAGREEPTSLRFRFAGTGISLLIWKSLEGGPFSVYIDEQFVNLVDSFSRSRERAEVPLTESLPDGPHVLSIVHGGGRTIFEGVRIQGKPILKGPPGWISIFPDSGVTTRETDYINIELKIRNLEPGLYGERIFLLSNGGDAEVEVFLEVTGEAKPRLLNVFRYVVDSNYLYTTDPRGETDRIQAKGYRVDGIAFRLFSPGTTGTTGFFRWFNPAKGDHFYSSDPAGGGKPLAGYLFEGAIGNIATSRLAGTRELYRWYHPKNGRHFYTTDQAGEGLGKKGYRFDGIAGFVR